MSDTEGKLTIVEDAPSLLTAIIRAASDPATDVDKLDRLLQMRERMEQLGAEADFNEAMTQAQTEMGRVKTNQSNTSTKSRYADYASLDRALRPIYTKHGFALSFNTDEGAAADAVRVVCLVSRGRFTRRYHVDMPSDGKGAKGGDVMTKTHATGAAMTYGMRYLLKMIFNVAIGEDDTDGNMPGALVTDAQVEQIKDLLDEAATATKSDYEGWLDLFLTKMQVDNLRELQVKDFERAKQSIVTAKAARAAK